jgi:hypothetical protein
VPQDTTDAVMAQTGTEKKQQFTRLQWTLEHSSTKETIYKLGTRFQRLGDFFATYPELSLANPMETR